jgi:hypothetical protein
MREAAVTWTWRYELADGSPAPGAGSGSFPTQGDAETWLGEGWQDLLESGVVQVSLRDGDRVVYGPMPLAPES